MLRKLVIIGSIAALFVLTAAPAFALSINTGPPGDQTAKTVLNIGTAPESNPAHGPLCGDGAPDTICEGGVSSPNPGLTPSGLAENSDLGINAGAWNAAFGPGGMSNLKTPICGVNVIPIVGLDDGTVAKNTCEQP